jgi:hypothetical protein
MNVFCLHCKESMIKDFVQLDETITRRIFRCDFCGFVVRVDD